MKKNYKVKRTKEATAIEILCGLIMLVSFILSIILMTTDRHHGSGMLIQSMIFGFCIFLTLFLVYSPEAFIIPKDANAEMYDATVRFLRYTSIIMSLLSLSITVIVFWNLHPLPVLTIIGIAMVGVLVWYFFTYTKAKRIH